MGWQGVTTVMLRNIPSRYSQQSLLAEIRDSGFYPDFFYLPMDFRRNANSGYAFINLDADRIPAFRRRFDGGRLEQRSSKLLQVVAAAVQGYEANHGKFAHSAVLNHHKAEHGPLFLRERPARAPHAPGSNARGGSGLFCLRELPPMYTRDMVAVELAHHGCAESVVDLHVPVDEVTGLNCGYALIRFVDAAAAGRGRCLLEGASFALAPAALAMSLAEVMVHSPITEPAAPWPQQVGQDAMRQDAPAFVPQALRAEAPAFAPPSPSDTVAEARSLLTEVEVVHTPDSPKSPPAADNQYQEEHTPWARYASLLASVPQEAWTPDLLLNHFQIEELQEMHVSALATLRQGRDNLGRFGALGIDLEDELEEEPCSPSTHPGSHQTPEKISNKYWAPGLDLCEAPDATPPASFLWRSAIPISRDLVGEDNSPNSSETPVVKPFVRQLQPDRLKHAPAELRPGSTPPTRSHSSGSERSASPCDLARVPSTPFDLARVAPSPPSMKRVRFSAQVSTQPFHADTPASLSSRRALPPPPPSGP